MHRGPRVDKMPRRSRPIRRRASCRQLPSTIAARRPQKIGRKEQEHAKRIRKYRQQGVQRQHEPNHADLLDWAFVDQQINRPRTPNAHHLSSFQVHSTGAAGAAHACLMDAGDHQRSLLERELIVDPYGTNQGLLSLQLPFSNDNSYINNSNIAALQTQLCATSSPSSSSSSSMPALLLQRLPYRQQERDHRAEAEPLVFDENWVWPEDLTTSTFVCNA
ncbi:uncharacterized protein ACA1_076730 [Acanthamoeba castellanii str. Neff]|uniref:Uncharacterized protein n=1 Tax=Acanthamoeba castellanii (strain ATCC 30010 / Neff) TaxID=1257118 RepID=L8GL71_ACACF|nr:uncharacterized protein ACA1_076730 [Acanthamoeba castellanii str. Neff]ELR13820.1 hypothetical protein ACA1_076730 [Acanthamoeba castellanii str. Neff]